MFSFALNDQMLTEEETALFSDCLGSYRVDNSIWDIYACFLRCPSKLTKPLVLRVYKGSELAGATFMVKCQATGKSLTNNKILYNFIDLFHLPCYIWIRVGFCAEVMANPGFVSNKFDYNEVLQAMINYIKKIAPMSFIIDHANLSGIHNKALAFSYVSDGSVDISNITETNDYVDEHKNIKRKIKEFNNKGGTITTIRGALGDDYIKDINNFLISTAKKSVIHSPFQDIYIDLALKTCKCNSTNIVHFIVKMNDEFIGYHSFIITGDSLRLMHGAFDRERKTNNHAYENLIIKSVEFSLQAGLKKIFYGPVLNVTKQRMMNSVEDVKMFSYQKNIVIRFLLYRLFPKSKMQSEKLLVFGSKRTCENSKNE